MLVNKVKLLLEVLLKHYKRTTYGAVSAFENQCGREGVL